MDFRVHAPCWLEPDVLLGIVLRDLPTARLAIEGVEWTGPSEDAYSGAAVARELAANPLTTAELQSLHVAADEFDMAALAGEDVIDAYAVIGEAGIDGQDGAIEVTVYISEGNEPSVVDQPWSAGPFVTYEINWVVPDPAARERRRPSEAFVASRRRVAPVVSAVTRSIVEATSGVVLDEDGFWFDRYRL